MAASIPVAVQSTEGAILGKITGVILTGGASARFGSDKALADLGGRPLLHHVIDRLAPQVSDLALAGGSYNLDLPTLSDGPFAGRGPLAGLLAGLKWSAAQEGVDWMQAAPCDVPHLPTNLVAQLLPRAPQGRPIAVRSGGHLQVGCALWPVTAIKALTDILEGGDKASLHRAFNALEGVALEAGNLGLEGRFDNINTGADLAACPPPD